MCGRYYIDDEITKEIEKLVKSLDEKIRTLKPGEVRPTQKAPVITGKDTELSAELCTWGFPSWTKNGVIFNARAETVFEKRMFKECIRKNRCAIPASRFYEWNSNKKRFTFTKEDKEQMYFAGFYEEFDGENRFVILTTKADAVMEPVHERMPVVLKEGQLSDWIYDEAAVKTILRQTPPKLRKETEYEQQKLDLWQ